MKQSIVSLPMYDWPEVHHSHDVYYKSLKDQLRASKFDAPDTLSRVEESLELWKSPNLLLSQTCGLPFTRFLEGKVALIGAPILNVNCPAGHYNSVIIVHKNSDIQDEFDLAGKQFGYNGLGSQSGYACIQSHLKQMKLPLIPHETSIETGGHRASIIAVAKGTVDFAAIDIVSWNLALRHEEASKRVCVIFNTAPRPALPYITSLDNISYIDQLGGIISNTIKTLQNDTRDQLFLTGFIKKSAEDYAIIKDEYDKIKTTN